MNKDWAASTREIVRDATEDVALKNGCQLSTYPCIGVIK